MYSSQCHVIVLTDGCLGDKFDTPANVKETHQKEVLAEASIVSGVKYIFMGCEDGTLFRHLNLLETIDFSQYTKVFVTSDQDRHPDHLAAYRCVIGAINKQKIKNLDLYTYEVHAPPTDENTLLDITSVADTKKLLIGCHASQLKQMPFDEMALSLARFRACQYGYSDKYIETYKKCGIMGDLIPDELNIKLQKHILFYTVLVKWMELLQDGENIVKKLQLDGYKTVAIYGYGELGVLLKNEIL